MNQPDAGFAGPRLDRRSVERKAQRVFRPQNFFRQDWFWEGLQEQIGFANVWCPIRRLVQEAARRHSHKQDAFLREIFPLVVARLEADREILAIAQKHWTSPLAYQRAVESLVKDRAKRIRRVADNGTLAGDFSFLKNVPRRALIAMNWLLSQVARGLSRSPINASPKEFVANLRRLFAKHPGPQLSQETKQIRCVRETLRKRGKKSSFGAIARKYYPEYATANGDRKLELRQRVRQAVRS